MNERDMQRIRDSRKELAERLAGAVRGDGFTEPMDGLRLNRSSQPTGRVPGISKPALCVIAQGAKESILAMAACASRASPKSLA
jgi:hypothetical protein